MANVGKVKIVTCLTALDRASMSCLRTLSATPICWSYGCVSALLGSGRDLLRRIDEMPWRCSYSYQTGVLMQDTLEGLKVRPVLCAIPMSDLSCC